MPKPPNRRLQQPYPFLFALLMQRPQTLHTLIGQIPLKHGKDLIPILRLGTHDLLQRLRKQPSRQRTIGIIHHAQLPQQRKDLRLRRSLDRIIRPLIDLRQTIPLSLAIVVNRPHRVRTDITDSKSLELPLRMQGANRIALLLQRRSVVRSMEIVDVDFFRLQLGQRAIAARDDVVVGQGFGGEGGRFGGDGEAAAGAHFA